MATALTTTARDELNRISLRAQLGAPTTALAAVSDRLYVGAGPRLVVWDISQPAHPRRLGQSGVLHGVVAGIAVQGSTAYLALSGERDLAIASLSDPSHPVQLGLVRLRDAPLSQVALCGDALVVADESQRLMAFGLPAQPGDDFVQLWRRGLHVGQAQALAANDRIVAVLTASRGVRLITLSDPAQPQLAATWRATLHRARATDGSGRQPVVRTARTPGRAHRA